MLKYFMPWLFLGLARPALAAAFSFAVLGDLPFNAEEERQTRTLLAALGQQRRMKFAIHNGNLKRPNEACVDEVFNARKALFEQFAAPLIYIPGTNDWIACGHSQASPFNPIVRLDYLRDIFFSESTALGKTRLWLTRQSDGARFSAYRENIRWETEGILFVGLNVPGENNHYLNQGGRNHEFEERMLANRAWLEQAAQAAKQRKVRALVIVVHGNPRFEREKLNTALDWRRVKPSIMRDGYREFRRDLLKLAQSFSGPVLLIHREKSISMKPGAAAPALFSVDAPLQWHSGKVMKHLTRLEIARLPSSKWLQITIPSGRRRPFFEVRLRNAPAEQALEETEPLPPQESALPPLEALPDETPALLPSPAFD